ncbi:MAG TPA: ribonuclease E activity regulator RraA [Myxococcota bacterium]
MSNDDDTAFSTCDLSDQHGERARILAPVFRHFGGRKKFHGVVATAKCWEDNSRVKELLATAGDGRVLVVDGGGSLRVALLGDMIGKGAVANGWAGVIVFGCVRDTAVLGQIDLGVLALASHPRRSHKNGEGQAQLAIEIAGARIKPGDQVFVDDDGVLVLDEITQIHTV